MGKSSYEIKRDIRRARDDLAANIHELEDKVKASTNSRRRYERSPGTFLALAFVGGLLLGVATNRSRSREPSDAYRPAISRRPKGPSRMDGPLRDMKAALIGLAASEGKKVIARLIPAITAHFAAGMQARPDAEPIRPGADNADRFDYR